MKTSHFLSIISMLAAGAAACDADDGTDEPDAGPCPTVYEDKDGDGQGTQTVSKTSCAPAPGWVESSDDCDDTSAYVNPLEHEVCDGIDNDCDNTTLDGTSCPGGCQPAVAPGTAKTYLFCSEQQAHMWPVASVMCRAHGFHLARIDDALENQYIHDTARALVGSITEYWLGGSDAQEGVWTWQDGTQFWAGMYSGAPIPNVYTHWAATETASEPNDGGDIGDQGVAEDCLAQGGAASTAPGEWNDMPCTHFLAFVCERD